MEFSPGTESRVRSSIFPDPVTFPMPDDRGIADGRLSETPLLPLIRGRELNLSVVGDLRYDEDEQPRRSAVGQVCPVQNRVLA